MVDRAVVDPMTPPARPGIPGRKDPPAEPHPHGVSLRRHRIEVLRTVSTDAWWSVRRPVERAFSWIERAAGRSDPRATERAPSPTVAPSRVSSFDLREQGAGRCISAPKHQGADGRNCVPFAVVAAMEGRIMYRDPPEDGAEADLSEADLVARAGMLLHPRDCLEFVAREGVALDACHLTPRCPPGQERHRYRLRFRSIRGVGRMQDALVSNGPLIGVIPVFENFTDFAGPQVYVPRGSQAREGHAVCIVGFSGEPSDRSGFWILKNSFGNDWGENGFFRIRFSDPRLRIENTVYVLTELIRM